MNILMVNKYLYRRGGSETYMFNLSEILKSYANNVSYFGLADIKNEILDDGLLLSENDISEYSLFEKIKAPINLIYSVKARKAFSKAIKKYCPDIIHINNFNFQITPSILFEAKKHGIKVVLTAHDPQLVCPNHRLYIPSKDIICEDCKGGKFYKCITNKCFDNSLSKSIIGAVESALYRNIDIYRKYVDLVIYPSTFLKLKVEELGFTHPNSIILPNFIASSPLCTDIKKDNYILFFGRLSSEKGIHTLIKAMDLLKNTGILLKIVGDGPLKQDVLDLLKSNNNKSIEYLGYKTGIELKELISYAKISIYPSEWYENCPYSIIESFSLGTPVIGSALGGIPELIENGMNGYTFEPKNHLQLAEQIKELYTNDIKLYQFSQNAYKKYRSYYSSEKYFQELIIEYNKLLN